MAKKITLKTSKNTSGTKSYIDTLSKEQQKEARTLLKVFKEATGVAPKMWGTSIIGYGEYLYQRSNGDEGTFMSTGFSMRKSGPTLYIMPGYQDYSALLAKLGPHKLGKCCLYLKNLEDIDLKVIQKIIKAGIKDLKKSHKVMMK